MNGSVGGSLHVDATPLDGAAAAAAASDSVTSRMMSCQSHSLCISLFFYGLPGYQCCFGR